MFAGTVGCFYLCFVLRRYFNPPVVLLLFVYTVTKVRTSDAAPWYPSGENGIIMPRTQSLLTSTILNLNRYAVGKISPTGEACYKEPLNYL